MCDGVKAVDNAATGSMIMLRDHLATRRTVPARFLSDPGPDVEALDQLITLGMRTPDHGKLAPWRFIVFRDTARKRAGEKIAAIARQNGVPEERLEEEAERFLRAPVVIAVISTAAPHVKIPEWEQVLSAGAVCMNLVHAASALGYSAQWLTEWMCYDAAARSALGLAEQEQLAGFIHIGTPTAPPTERDRPALAKHVTHFPA